MENQKQSDKKEIKLELTTKFERLIITDFICLQCGADFVKDHGIWLNVYGFGPHQLNEMFWFCDMMCLEIGTALIEEAWKKERKSYLPV